MDIDLTKMPTENGIPTYNAFIKAGFRVEIIHFRYWDDRLKANEFYKMGKAYKTGQMMSLYAIKQERKTEYVLPRGGKTVVLICPEKDIPKSTAERYGLPFLPYSGVAVCHEDDHYVRVRGIAIALEVAWKDYCSKTGCPF
jgi:hypothetical protein